MIKAVNFDSTSPVRFQGGENKKISAPQMGQPAQDTFVKTTEPQVKKLVNGNTAEISYDPASKTEKTVLKDPSGKVLGYSETITLENGNTVTTIHEDGKVITVKRDPSGAEIA